MLDKQTLQYRHRWGHSALHSLFFPFMYTCSLLVSWTQQPIIMTTEHWIKPFTEDDDNKISDVWSVWFASFGKILLLAKTQSHNLWLKWSFSVFLFLFRYLTLQRFPEHQLCINYSTETKRAIKTERFRLKITNWISWSDISRTSEVLTCQRFYWKISFGSLSC